MRLKKKLAAAVSAVAMVGAAAGIAIGAGGAAGAATGPTGGTWEAAEPFPGFTASNASLSAIACSSPGDCAAVGDVSGTPITVNESSGVWGSAQDISGLDGLASSPSGTLTDVSCGAPGDCTAAGWYIGSLGVGTAFYVSETAGTWGAAVAVTSADQPAGTYSRVTGLSCLAAGDCTLVGHYTNQGMGNVGQPISVPFTLDENNGTWGTPQPVPGLASLPSANGYADLNSVSCLAAGSCTASGEYGGDSLGGRPFVVSEAGSAWGNAVALPGPVSVGATAVSCPDPSDCAVVMIYTASYPPLWYTADEAQGTWGQAQLLGGQSSSVLQNSGDTALIGCRSAGNCVIAGDMGNYAGSTQEPFTATETSSGNWGAATIVPGIDASTQTGMMWRLSCVPGGDCTLAGTDRVATSNVDYIWTAVSSPGGSVGAAQQHYHSASPNNIYGLSCPQDGYCALAFDLSNNYMLGVETSASAVALTESASGLTYGAEQSETLTATVSSPAGGTPAGTVTIKSGTATVCTATLSAGSGTCTLTPTQLPGGTSQLTASYGGSADYAGSTSATKTVTVAKAASKTTLVLSATTITYGHEQTEHLTVTVAPQYSGTPAGKVTVKSGTATICTITLASGSGACTLSAHQLSKGTHTLTAAYSGNGNFKSSVSAKKTLKVK